MPTDTPQPRADDDAERLARIRASMALIKASESYNVPFLLRLLDSRDAALREAREDADRLSAAYVRLRAMIPGAFDTPHAPSPETVWRITEEALAKALARPQPATPSPTKEFERLQEIEKTARRVRDNANHTAYRDTTNFRITSMPMWADFEDALDAPATPSPVSPEDADEIAKRIVEPSSTPSPVPPQIGVSGNCRFCGAVCSPGGRCHNCGDYDEDKHKRWIALSNQVQPAPSPGATDGGLPEAGVLAALRRPIGALQELVVNVRYWIAHGCSETAVKALDGAMKDGWASIGWPEASAVLSSPIAADSGTTAVTDADLDLARRVWAECVSSESGYDNGSACIAAALSARGAEGERIGRETSDRAWKLHCGLVGKTAMNAGARAEFALSQMLDGLTIRDNNRQTVKDYLGEHFAFAESEGERAGIERAAQIAQADSGTSDCPYTTDKSGDPTWDHTDEDVCPLCKQKGTDDGSKCRGLARERIATAIRSLLPPAAPEKK